MSEKKSSQSQHGAPIFEPFQAFTQEQLTRMNAIFDEWKKMEAQGIERATTAVDEMAGLVKTTFGYATQIGDEWRKLALEAGRHAVDIARFRVQ